MKRNSAQRNIESLTLIANRLGELCNDMTFLGGCVMSLLITDQAAPDVRFTVDVDCIVNVITKSHYYSLSEKLRKKGFKEIPYENHPICRWNCDGVLVDIMPIDKSILGFSNKWYKDALSNALTKKINRMTNIKIISAPYFLATKFEAFKSRGNNDFLLSHDLEDILSLIDGRPTIVNDVSSTNDRLKQYLHESFVLLLHRDQFLQALPGHLNYSEESEAREKIVLERMQAIINLGK